MAGLSAAVRRLGPAAAVVCAVVGLCSCGSGNAATTGHSAGGYALRYAQAPAMLVQCGFDRGVVSPGGPQPWYRLGTVLPQTAEHRAEFATWWKGHSSATVAGRSLADWRQWAAGRGKLPPMLCGAFAPAAALHKQIYPGEPNPWRS